MRELRCPQNGPADNVSFKASRWVYLAETTRERPDLNVGEGKKRYEKTEEKIQYGIQKLQEEYGDYIESTRETQQQLMELLKDYAEEGYTPKEREILERQIDERIELKRKHLERIKSEDAEASAPPEPTPEPEPVPETTTGFEFKSVKADTWIENIATKNGTTVEQIKEDNSGKIHKVTASVIQRMKENGQNWEKHLGKHYSTAAEIQVRVPKAEPAKPDLSGKSFEEARKEQLGHFAGEATARSEDFHSRLAEAQNYEGILEQYGDIKSRGAKLPKFLRNQPFDHINRNEWSELITRALTETEEGTRHTDLTDDTMRVIHVISESPFGWNPVYFRDVVRKGCPVTLSFNNIVKMSSYRMNQKQFFKMYEEAMGKEKSYDDATTPNGKEWKRLTEGWESKNSTYNESLNTSIEGLTSEENETPEQFEARKARLAAYKRLGNEEGTDYEPLVAWKKRIDGLTPKNNAETTAKWNAEAYYREVRDTEDALKTIRTERAGNMEKVKEYENFIIKSSELLDALEAATEGTEITDDAEKAATVRREALGRGADDNGMYWGQALDSAFQPIDKDHTVTFADIADREGIVYKKSGLLTRRMDVRAAHDRIISNHTTYNEAGQAVIDQAGIEEDLKYYLEQGVVNAFMDPQLDIVEELEKVGVELPKETAQKLKKAQKEAQRVSREIRRKQMERMERLAAKEDTLRGKAEKAGERGHENREERLEGRAEGKLDKQRELREELFGETGLYAQLLGQKKIVSQILQDSTGMEALLENWDLEIEEGATEPNLTDEQRRFIQNGYIITEGVDLTLKEEMDKQEIINWYKENNPAAHQILLQLVEADAEGKLSRGDLQYAGEQITDALNSMEYTVIETTYDDLTAQPDDQLRSKERTFGVMGTTRSHSTDGEFDRMTAVTLGGFIDLPIRNLNGEVIFNVHIGAQIGWSETGGYGGGAGGGISKTFEARYIKITTSVDAGAKANTSGDISAGGAASLTLGVGTKDVAVFGGVSVGAEINIEEGKLVPGFSIHGGIKFAPMPSTSLERGRQRADIESGKAYVDAATSPEERFTRMMEVPEFQSMVASINTRISEYESQAGTTVPESTRQALIADSFDFYTTEMQMHGEAYKKVAPISGVSFILTPFFPFPIPILHIHIRNKTKVYPLTDHGRSFDEMAANSEEKIYAQIMQEMGGSVEIGPTLDGGSPNLSQEPAYTYDREGNLSVLPSSTVSSSLEAMEIAHGNLDSQNAKLRTCGMELTPGEGDAQGLLKLNIYGEKGEVVIVPDPSMRADVIVGNNTNEIYLGFDQVSSGLIITRQEFHFTRKENDAWTSYKKTVITIKENPDPRRNFNTFLRDERGGSVEFRGEGSTMNVDNRGNVWRMSELTEERRAVLEEMGYFSPEEDIEATARALEAAAESPIDYNELDELAVAFFEANSKEVLAALTNQIGETEEAQSAQFKAMFDKMKAAHPELAEKYTTEALQDSAYGYMVNVLYRISYVHVEAKDQQEFARNHKAFFRQILVKEFGSETFADQVLSEISIDKLDFNRTMTIAPNAWVYSVVGREGQTGLREDLTTGGKLVSFVDYSDNPEMIKQIVEGTEAFEIAQETEAFLRHPMALTIFAKYTRMKGTAAKQQLIEIYENPTLASDGGDYQAAFEAFKKVVMDFKEALEQPDPRRKFITVEDQNGVPRIYVVDVAVYAGVREECTNPQFAIIPILEPLPGLRTAAMDQQYEEARPRAKTDVVNLLVGYMHHNLDETIPPPPDDEPEPEEGEPSGVGTGIIQGPVRVGDLVGTPPGGGDQGGGSTDTGGQVE